jgi:hypothetical protein
MNDKIEKLFTDQELLSDKYYIYADVIFKEKENEYIVKIDSNDFKTTLHKDKDIVSVYELRENKVNYMEIEEDVFLYKKQLISAGLLAVFNNNKNLFLKRDNGAPVEPNKIQIPAGRCSASILKTAVKEFVEEIGISYLNGKSMNATKDLKNKQIHFKNSKVITYLDEEMIEEINVMVIHDKENNTMENFLILNFPYNIENFNFKDNEYGREIIFSSLEELKKEDLVSNLKIFQKKYK